MTPPLKALGRLCLLLLCGAAVAAPVRFDIPAQPAPSALQLFMKQSGAQVMFLHDELKDVTGNEVKGDLEPVQALDRILSGTGFIGKQKSASNFTVVRADSEKPGSIEGQVRDESGRPVPDARVSVAGSENGTLTDRRGRFLLEDVPAGAQAISIFAEGMQKTRVTDVVVRAGHRHTLSAITIPAVVAGITQLEDYIVSAKKNDAVVELDPYEVSGEQAKPFSAGNLDLPRSENDALPFQVFTAMDIGVSGAASLQDFLDSRLAQNFNTDILGEREGLNLVATANAKGVNMRGWDRETVILLNGRRMPPQYDAALPTGEDSSPDLRMLPLGAIERIEILSSAGSAIYGQGASGGVINIITRRDYRGGHLAFTYETPTDVHRPSRAVEFSYARPLSDRLALRVGGSRRETRPLLGSDRLAETIARWRAEINARSPTRLQSRTAIPPYGSTTNIRTNSSAASANLFGAGTPNFTSVPVGYSGGAGISAFDSRRGMYNFSLTDTNADALSEFGPSSNIDSASVGLDLRLNSDWRLSADYRYGRNRSEGGGTTNAGRSGFYFGSRTVANQRVPAAAPSNPFAQDVWVAFYDPSLNKPELIQSYEVINHDVAVTLFGSLGEWRGFFDASYGHSENENFNFGYYEPIGGWGEAFLSGRYNPFRDFLVAAPADASFYDRYVQQVENAGGAAKTYQSALKLSGPLYALPAGMPNLTVGADWSEFNRYDAHTITRWVDSSSGQLHVPTGRTTAIENPNDRQARIGSTQSLAGYAEISVPLVEPKFGWPAIKALQVFASGRWSEESMTGFRTDFSSVAADGSFSNKSISAEMEPKRVYAFGYTHRVADGVTIRASRSLGYIPPHILDLVPNSFFTHTEVLTDPRRNGENVRLEPSQYLMGGNPHLRSESTTSSNVGLIVESRKADGLRLSIDYLENRRNNAITQTDPQSMVNGESEFPERISRGPSDGHPSGVGPIIFVDATTINLLEVSSKSVDLTLDQRWKNVLSGNLVLSVSATRNLSFAVQATSTSAPIEQVRNPGAQGFAFARQLKWNGNAQLRWEGKRWMFGWSSRYFDDWLVNPRDLVIQGFDRAERAYNHDAYASYRFVDVGSPGWRSLLERSSVTIGLKNIFAREPRFWAANTSRGIVTADSVSGRTVWVQLKKEF